MNTKRINITPLQPCHVGLLALVAVLGSAGMSGRVAAAAPSVTVTLTHSFRPNPLVIRGQSHPRPLSLRRNFGTASRCSGWVAREPDAVIVLPRGLPRARFTFSGGGEGFGDVYIQLPDRKYYCGQRKVTLDSWPAGRLGIYFRRQTMWRNKVGPFTITVEDLSRPRTSTWSARVKTIVLPKKLSKPRIFSGATGDDLQLSRNHRDYSCQNLVVATEPIALLKVDRPRDDLMYALTSSGRVALQIIGPITKSRRGMRERCRVGAHGKIGRLEPGVYALKVGQRAKKRGVAAVGYTLLFRTEHTRMNPFAVAAVPAGLPVRARMVSRHYPQLDKDFWRSNERLQRLFASAPKELFVFPTFDLDKASAKQVGSQTRRPIYPRKNEPMLLFANRWIVGADGATFSVQKYSYLATSPTGPIALPRAPRNLELSSSDAIKQLGAKDQAAYKAHRRRMAAEKRCVDRVWSPTNRTIAALRQRAWSRWRAKRIASLKDRAGSKAFRVCGTARLRRNWAQLQKRLLRTRRARRARRLKALRARLMRLFRS